MNDDEILKRLIEGARKIKYLFNEELLHHVIICNFQSPNGNGNGRCNCGITDLIYALKMYDQNHPEEAIEVFRKNKNVTNDSITVGVCQGCGHMSKWGGIIEGSRQHVCSECKQYVTVVFHPPK